jgi:hypothetical protein
MAEKIGFFQSAGLHSGQKFIKQRFINNSAMMSLGPLPAMGASFDKTLLLFIAVEF